MGRIKRGLLLLWAALFLLLLLPACQADEAEAPTPDDPPSAPAAPAAETAGLDPLPLAGNRNALTGRAAPSGMKEGQRPVAIMVANNEASFPQRGLAAADVVVEMLTEGGITRLMALYADYSAVPEVGPVRSTRDQFVQFMLPSCAIPVHIGSSVYARNLLTVTDYDSIDGLRLGRSAFHFDDARHDSGSALEYCWFTDSDGIWQGMETLDVHTTGEVRSLFRFAEKQAQQGQQAQWVGLTYSGTAQPTFVYSEKRQDYRKTAFGKTHRDEDDTALRFDNLILLRCAIGLKVDGQLPDFDLSGGSGVYINSGNATPFTWIKGSPDEPLRLLDEDGRELEVQPGKSYIGVLPDNEEAIRYAEEKPEKKADSGAEEADE